MPAAPRPRTPGPEGIRLILYQVRIMPGPEQLQLSF
jgi:hypothetical protein